MYHPTTVCLLVYYATSYNYVLTVLIRNPEPPMLTDLSPENGLQIDDVTDDTSARYVND